MGALVSTPLHHSIQAGFATVARLCLAVGSILAMIMLAAGPATTQGNLDGGVHIGVIVPNTPNILGEEIAAAISRSAAQGAILAQEEYQIHAEMFSIEMSVLTEKASGDDVIAAAERLVDEYGVFGLIGGFTFDEARQLGIWAEARGVPFLNVAASNDSLRNELCSATTFHVAPSAAMYLDALSGWYVRAGFRRWYVIQEDSIEGQAQYERMDWSITERHFGVREVGREVLAKGEKIDSGLVRDIERSRADLILLMLDTDHQLAVLGELDAAGVQTTVTGFPHSETQTRTFFEASRQVAPNLGTGHRAADWEATLDAYGAREYNARYLLRWEEPMDPAAWATYHAVRILFEAAFYGGSVLPTDVLSYLSGEQTIFDLHKGLGATFRPWDRQLRQSLYLIKIEGEAVTTSDLGLLVGELPAIYLPGVEPVERLDQLGDMENRSRCER